MNRGDIYDAELPSGPRPVVIVTREGAIPVLSNVTVVAITSSVRGLVTEVPLGREHGLARECVVNCDNFFTVPKTTLTRLRGSLGSQDIRKLDQAISVALGLLDI